VCSGAALLVEAANMGDSDAQYELGCRLRIEVFHTSCSLFLSLNELVMQISAKQLALHSAFDLCRYTHLY
jgi:hypothetical protein